MTRRAASSRGTVERIILPLALNFETTESGLPERIDLLPAGNRIVGRDGRSWNNPNPGAVAERVNGTGIDLVLDVEHATELKAPKGEPAPAAAWLHDLRVEQDGRITAAIRSWTPAGEAAVLNREYRYISPAVTYDAKTMVIVGISSAGLTNKPNLPLTALNHEQSEEDTMLKKLLAKLALGEDATEEMALNAIGRLQTDLQTALNSAQTPPLDKFVPRADYEVALNRAATAEAKIATAEKEKLDGEIETAINQALTEGKIAPASKDYYTAMCRTEGGLEQFRTFIAAAPKIVPDSGLGGKKPENGQQTALNAQEQEICRNLDLSEEEYLKTAL
ncbi:phage protease [Desulfobulbus elongatus]|uniref:phage protease n=1 Tax=Desulfobulbus elongatus TaxID=53332 RepID=UPI0004857436|nr:phage protease [Desulfobulbus elongatus]